MGLVPWTSRTRRMAARALIAVAMLCLGTSATAQTDQTVNGDIIRMVVYTQGRADISVKPSTAAGPSARSA